jgi:hypothetical protein
MAAADTNTNLWSYLKGEYVATWPAGKDLNVMTQRRVTVTATTGEMNARVLAALVAARNAA